MRWAIIIFFAEFSVQIYPSFILHFDTIDGMLGKQVIFFFHKSYAVFSVGNQQHMAGILVVFQDILTPSSENNGIAFISDLSDNIM
jgi:hypothetical protein